jgi:Flp pilus assembly protein TadB
MAVLAGERERERAAYELRRHYREGRLTVDELGERLEAALRARSRVELRAALRDLPGPGQWAEPDALREALRSPVRAVRNAAILVGTALIWLLWSVGLFAAFVAWLAANGASLGTLLVFPALWFASSWLLWTGSRRRRLRP